MSWSDIKQLFTFNQSQAIRLGSSPSANNTFKTFQDANSVAWTADVVASRVGVTAMANVISIPIPVNAQIKDGRTLRFSFTANYTKTVGVSTTRWQVVTGGITLLFTATSMGNAARTIDTYTIQVEINFRAGNTAQVFARIQRTDDSVGTPLEILTVKTIAPGLWNKAIANSLDMQYQTVTGAGITHTLTFIDATAELL